MESAPTRSVRERVHSLFFQKASTRQLQLDSLDGLRGVAVVFVVLVHLSNRDFTLVPGANFAGAGKCAVMLFYVLSAFLLTQQMIRSDPTRLRTGSFWTRYGIRRVLRIYPAYALVLGISVLSAQLGSTLFIRLTPDQWVLHMLLLQGRQIYWSIPVEFKYYLVLPVIALVFVIGMRRLPTWVPTLVLAGVVVGVDQAWPGRAFNVNTIALLPYLSVFLLGSLAAFAHRLIGERGGVTTRAGKTASEAIALLALAGVILLIPSVWSKVTGQSFDLARFERDYSLFGLLWATFLVAQLHGLGWARRALCWGPLRFFGVISFSMYLLHLSALRLFGFILEAPPALVALCTFALLTPVSALLYLAVERPFMKIGNRVGRARAASG